MKRLLCLLLCSILFVACGTTKETKKKDTAVVEKQKEEKKKKEEEAKKLEEQKKQEEEAKKLEEQKKQEEEAKKLEEQKRLEEQKKAEEAKKQEELKRQQAPVATNNNVVAIDAGHQARGNSQLEPIGPGASTQKAKVASGATGTATRIPEYQTTLNVSLKLRDVLQSRGYKVIMIRTTNDVNISNRERAEMANNAGAGAFIRLHCDGIGNSGVTGASVQEPANGNPYMSAGNVSASQSLGRTVLNHYCSTTGIRNRGMAARNDLSGINWCKTPVCLLEMGFISNGDEDRKLNNSDFQQKIAEGIANGIDAYFGR